MLFCIIGCEQLILALFWLPNSWSSFVTSRVFTEKEDFQLNACVDRTPLRWVVDARTHNTSCIGNVETRQCLRGMPSRAVGPLTHIRLRFPIAMLQDLRTGVRFCSTLLPRIRPFVLLYAYSNSQSTPVPSNLLQDFGSQVRTDGRVGIFLHKFDSVVATRDTGYCAWRVLWAWVSDNSCMWIRQCRTHRPPPDFHVLQNHTIPHPKAYHLRRFCGELVGQGWKVQRAQDNVK